MVTDKFGSRVFERFWFFAEPERAFREQLLNSVFLPFLTGKVSAERECRHVEHLQNKNHLVYILLGKVGAKQFRESPKQWRADLDKQLAEGRKLLNNFVPGHKGPQQEEKTVDGLNCSNGNAFKKRKKKSGKKFEQSGQ